MGNSLQAYQIIASSYFALTLQLQKGYPYSKVLGDNLGANQGPDGPR